MLIWGWERLIDRLVYQLYRLSPEEIQIVEGTGNEGCGPHYANEKILTTINIFAIGFTYIS